MDNNKVYWCCHCKIPVLFDEKADKKVCNLCGTDLIYLSSDIRPVFPEERLFFELIIGKPLEFIEKSVWCNNSTYFVDEEKYKISGSMWENIKPSVMIEKLEYFKPKNTYRYFDEYINKFVSANKSYFYKIRFEATNFIRDTVYTYRNIHKYISFSGGKDSTVVSDLVIKALGDPSILHVFCDTTLEFPYTLEYVKRMKEDNPKYVFKTIRNKEHDFYKLCDDIGVPSVSKRWCCTVFKSGISSKFLNQFFIGQKVLTFSGLRRSESNVRKKYKRIEDKNEKKKIQNQIMISPIIDWIDADVWLYILSENIDFNDSYRFGFSRVGCFCCPNATNRGDILAEIYMQDKYQHWYDYLIKYAERIGKENPRNYIDKGKWKLSRGGEGLESSKDVKIEKKVCTTDEYSKVYKLNKPINDDFYMLFIPFGDVRKELGRKALEEVLILRNKVPIISICPMGTDSVKIKTLNVKNHKVMQSKIAYQVLKFNACRKCYKCESVCSFGAISIRNGIYKISEDICKHCLSCVDPKYIADGCVMKGYLKARDNINEQ